jgi:nucleotide-binding universal stress UspA family protein
MTRVLVAVDETDESVEAARAAHRLFGDDAEYLAVNVARRDVGGSRSDPDRPPGSVVAWGQTWPFAPMHHLSDPATFRTWQGREPSSVEPSWPPPQEHAAGLASRQAFEAGVGARGIGEVGDPADAIVEAARAHEVDVIVVGSHERGWFSRLFHHSVSTEVARHADIPVLVVG